MNSWKVILATIVIFGAGVVTGGLLVNYVDHGRPANHRPANPREPEEFVPAPEILKTNFIQRLDNSLHLTTDQRAQIEKIIADGQSQNQKLWKMVAPQFRPIMQDTRQKIRAVLTDEQKKEFEQLLHRPRRAANFTNAPAILPDTNLPTATNSPAN